MFAMPNLSRRPCRDRISVHVFTEVNVWAHTGVCIRAAIHMKKQQLSSHMFATTTNMQYPEEPE
jgi:hypothetical protein